MFKVLRQQKYMCEIERRIEIWSDLYAIAVKQECRTLIFKVNLASAIYQATKCYSNFQTILFLKLRSIWIQYYSDLNVNQNVTTPDLDVTSYLKSIIILCLVSNIIIGKIQNNV